MRGEKTAAKPLVTGASLIRETRAASKYREAQEMAKRETRAKADEVKRVAAEIKSKVLEWHGIAPTREEKKRNVVEAETVVEVGVVTGEVEKMVDTEEQKRMTEEKAFEAFKKRRLEQELITKRLAHEKVARDREKRKDEETKVLKQRLEEKERAYARMDRVDEKKVGDFVVGERSLLLC